MNKKKKSKRQLTLVADNEEQAMFSMVKMHHKRSSDSDMIRTLIVNEHEKILSANGVDTPTVSNQNKGE